MAHPLKHARSSAKKFGGQAEDYLAVHNWFDESKAFFADFRHRALRHHAEGIFLSERIFGVTITNSEGNQVPVRYIGSNSDGPRLAVTNQATTLDVRPSPSYRKKPLAKGRKGRDNQNVRDS